MKPIKLKQLDTKVAYYLTTKEEVLLYLNELIQKEKTDEFCTALYQLVKSKGFDNIAKETTLNRDYIYREFKIKKNPCIKTFFSVLNSLGFQLRLNETNRFALV
ncbi:addiction module antidote protein [Helicobacter pylori]|uniref:addiction module antidote protein n=1 Tax=Helicobacter pylori TaxID=210 RepID=UPI0009A3FA92|nr:addiction module antidote protein [Helicobacter pylori]KAA6505682.1 putative addiction module antidote protein [Helicobacter pylori]MBH0240921.1 putative addiction module antidote protein [Helicobacter pylori]OPG48969.1 putative addiction module antidote protein [Helicobacter pylori]RVZ23536.1 putative addiction module antidote protein [Helicobacter pylori]